MGKSGSPTSLRDVVVRETRLTALCGGLLAPILGRHWRAHDQEAATCSHPLSPNASPDPGPGPDRRGAHRDCPQERLVP